MLQLITETYNNKFNKYRKFLGKISAESCLKMDYFGSKSQKSPKPLCIRWQPRLDLMTKECARPYTSIEHFWIIRCLAILGQTEIYLPFVYIFLHIHVYCTGIKTSNMSLY